MAWGCGQADPREPIIRYRSLREIEACFRINKDDLGIRPIFHWKERRVHAHVAIGYMAFCRIRHLRARLRRMGCEMAADRIRRALNELRICITRETGGRRRFCYPMPENGRCPKNLPNAESEMECSAVRIPPLEGAQAQDFLIARNYSGP